MSADGKNADGSTPTCGTAGQRVDQAGQSFVASLGGLLGMTQFINDKWPSPLNKIQSEASVKNAATTKMIQDSTLKAINLSTENDKELLATIQKAKDVLEAEISFHNTLLNLKIEQNSLYVFLLWILVLVSYSFVVLNTKSFTYAKKPE